MKVCVGGTFDPFHKGHRALIDKAFEIGTEVFIGLTSDEMAQSSRTLCVRPYEKRKSKLEKYFKKKSFEAKKIIVVLDNRFGPSIREDFKVIIVSPETKPIADKLNKLRNEKGLDSLKIIKVPYVLARDGTPISSTRIKEGEIDVEGKMLREVIINIGSKNNIKIEATKEVFSKFFDKICVKGYEIESNVSTLPFNDEIINGAVNRAKNVIGKGDFGVGIEAGIYWNKETKRYFGLHYCAIVDKMKRITIGHSSGFEYPEEIISGIKRGKSTGEVLKSISKYNIEKGMIYYLSKGFIERKELIYKAILMAFVPRLKLCF